VRSISDQVRSRKLWVVDAARVWDFMDTRISWLWEGRMRDLKDWRVDFREKVRERGGEDVQRARE